MKQKQNFNIVSIEYTNDEESKNKLIKLIIDCLLSIDSGGVLSNNAAGTEDD